MAPVFYSGPLLCFAFSFRAEFFHPHGLVGSNTLWGGWPMVFIPAASLEGFDRRATSVTDWSPVTDLLGFVTYGVSLCLWATRGWLPSLSRFVIWLVSVFFLPCVGGLTRTPNNLVSHNLPVKLFWTRILQDAYIQ